MYSHLVSEETEAQEALRGLTKIGELASDKAEMDTSNGQGLPRGFCWVRDLASS